MRARVRARPPQVRALFNMDAARTPSTTQDTPFRGHPRDEKNAELHSSWQCAPSPVDRLVTGSEGSCIETHTFHAPTAWGCRPSFRLVSSPDNGQHCTQAKHGAHTPSSGSRRHSDRMGLLCWSRRFSMRRTSAPPCTSTTRRTGGCSCGRWRRPSRTGSRHPTPPVRACVCVESRGAGSDGHRR
jgi:hypothetical protein